jgi:hypothetical protein
MKRLFPLLLLAASTLFAACVTMDSPQRHAVYYRVEHMILPSMWFGDRAELEKAFREKAGEALLEQFRSIASEASVTLPGNLAAAVEEIDLGNGWSGWLVTFPEPLTMPESKYSLLISKGDELRFYTWEFDNAMGPTLWFLCEWTPDHTHMDYGPREDGSKENFIRQVKLLMEKRTNASASTRL